MIIAVEGCAHGELQQIYDTLTAYEKQNGFKIDLLLICGDFQATRNEHDLACMACPRKFKKMCTFYKYYSGELIAPILTIFIGGNHEASNYSAELWLGGWAAPNIYFLGNNGCVNFGGYRIGGLSGIYKPYNYCSGWNENFPLNERHQRSIYHVREFQVEQLKLLQQNPPDIFLSHDWPVEMCYHGNTQKLLKIKPYFKEDVDNHALGSQAAQELLETLKTKYWFSAHLHVKFPAIFHHSCDESTRFLALDKCLPGRGFLQLVHLDDIEGEEHILKHDPLWLTILRKTQNLVKWGPTIPSTNFKNISEEEIQETLEKFGSLEIHSDDFVQTANVIEDLKQVLKGVSPNFMPNPQTLNFCSKLNIEDFWTNKFSPTAVQNETGENSGQDDNGDEWGDGLF